MGFLIGLSQTRGSWKTTAPEARSTNARSREVPAKTALRSPKDLLSSPKESRDGLLRLAF